MTCKRSLEFLKDDFLPKEVNSKDVKWRYFCPQNIRKVFFVRSIFIVRKLNRLKMLNLETITKTDFKIYYKINKKRGKNSFYSLQLVMK